MSLSNTTSSEVIPELSAEGCSPLAQEQLVKIPFEDMNQPDPSGAYRRMRLIDNGAILFRYAAAEIQIQCVTKVLLNSLQPTETNLCAEGLELLLWQTRTEGEEGIPLVAVYRSYPTNPFLLWDGNHRAFFALAQRRRDYVVVVPPFSEGYREKETGAEDCRRRGLFNLTCLDPVYSVLSRARWQQR